MTGPSGPHRCIDHPEVNLVYKQQPHGVRDWFCTGCNGVPPHIEPIATVTARKKQGGAGVPMAYHSNKEVKVANAVAKKPTDTDIGDREQRIARLMVEGAVANCRKPISYQKAILLASDVLKYLDLGVHNQAIHIISTNQGSSVYLGYHGRLALARKFDPRFGSVSFRVITDEKEKEVHLKDPKHFVVEASYNIISDIPQTVVKEDFEDGKLVGRTTTTGPSVLAISKAIGSADPEKLTKNGYADVQKTYPEEFANAQAGRRAITAAVGTMPIPDDIRIAMTTETIPDGIDDLDKQLDAPQEAKLLDENTSSQDTEPQESPELPV